MLKCKSFSFFRRTGTTEGCCCYQWIEALTTVRLPLPTINIVDFGGLPSPKFVKLEGIEKSSLVDFFLKNEMQVQRVSGVLAAFIT